MGSSIDPGSAKPRRTGLASLAGVLLGVGGSLLLFAAAAGLAVAVLARSAFLTETLTGVVVLGGLGALYLWTGVNVLRTLSWARRLGIVIGIVGSIVLLWFALSTPNPGVAAQWLAFAGFHLATSIILTLSWTRSWPSSTQAGSARLD